MVRRAWAIRYKALGARNDVILEITIIGITEPPTCTPPPPLGAILFLQNDGFIIGNKKNPQNRIKNSKRIVSNDKLFFLDALELKTETD